MTREEQIEQASCNFTGEYHNAEFHEGVKQSDEHPREGLWDKDKVCRWIKEHLTFDDTKWYTDKDYVKSIMDEVIEDLTKATER